MDSIIVLFSNKVYDAPATGEYVPLSVSELLNVNSKSCCFNAPKSSSVAFLFPKSLDTSNLSDWGRLHLI